MPKIPSRSFVLAVLCVCIFFIAISSASDDISLGFGQTVNGTISQAGETDNYTFTGTAGDWVLGRAASSRGPYIPSLQITPRIQLYGPTGILLGTYNQYPTYTAPSFHLQLPATGTYTMIVADDDGRNTGEYGVTVQRTNNPGNAVAIGYGDTRTGTIPGPAVFDTYTFSAQQGDLVYTRLSSAFGWTNYADLRLYGPNGVQLAAPNGSSPVEISVTAPATGTYTILAGDAYGSYDGTYGIYLQHRENSQNAIPLNFGQTLNGTINTAGEMDAYTFTGTSGDWVLGRAASGRGSYIPTLQITPRIQLYGPTGTLLGTYNQYQTYTAPSFLLQLPTTGTYTVLVSDDNGQNTGEYGVMVQRTNNPGNAVAIGYGDTRTGTIPGPAVFDMYTFSAQQGDLVYTRLSSAFGWTNYADLRLYGPNGVQLAAPNGSSPVEISVTAPTTGTYTILAGDAYGSYDGAYGVYLQRRENSQNGVPLNFGQTLNGTISAAGEMDAYTFTGTTGDWVLGRAASGRGSYIPTLQITPRIQLYGPTGSLLGTYDQYQYYTGPSFLLQLPASGTYTVLVSDDDGRNTGDYGVMVQRTNNPGNAVAIGYGDTATGSIPGPAEFDTYTFAAQQGDPVYIRLSSSFGWMNYADLRLFGPNGALLSAPNGSSPLEISVAAPTTGTYTILAGDAYGSYDGNYGIYLQLRTGPIDGVTLGFGQTVNGTISQAGEMDAYTFTGTAGDWILGRAASGRGTYIPSLQITPRIQVYGPTGTLIGTCDQYQYYTAPSFMLQLPATGTYTMIVADDDGRNTGEYGVMVQRTNNPGNAVAIGYGDTRTGSIPGPAEFDTFTFAAQQGDLVYTRLSSSFGWMNYADLRLFGPNGVQLAAPNGSSPVEISVTAPTTGTYTLLAGDAYGSYDGTYGVYLQRRDSPGNAVALGYGQTINGAINTVGEMDAYTFTGTTGDWVVGRAASGRGSYIPSLQITPRIQLYGPTGTLLGTYNQYQYYTAPSFLFQLPTSGTYTVLVSDDDGRNTGDYGVMVQRTNNPGNAVTIRYGDTVTGSIAVPAQLDTYTYAAERGDPIHVKLTSTFGWVNRADLRLYGPDGGQIVAPNGSSPLEISSAAPTTGTYTLLAGDAYGSYGGSYSLEFSMTGGFADLAPAQFSFPAQVDTLEGLNLSWVTENCGDGPIFTPWYDTLYLSTDRQLDSADINLSSERVATVLRSGQNYTAATTIHLSTAVPDGTYFLILKVDALDAIAETSEWNNLIIQPICIGTEGAFTETASDHLLLSGDLKGQMGTVTGSVRGSLTGPFNVTSFEMVTITSGPFVGQGFFSGLLTASLDNVSHQGDLKGILYPDPGNGRIMLKGTIGGSETTGIMEGFLTESQKGSGVFDHLETIWKVNRIGGAYHSVELTAAGDVDYAAPVSYTSVSFDLLQSTIRGSVFGDYDEPLSITLNRLMIADTESPYTGQGFARISYVSQAGQGEGWAYVSALSGNVEDLSGVFGSPLAGIMSGTISTAPPRSVILAIERTDLGLPITPYLTVQVTGPERVSPGQQFAYVITVSNQGFKNADNVSVRKDVSPDVDFVWASGDSYFNNNSLSTYWDVGRLEPFNSVQLTETVRLHWGLPFGQIVYDDVTVRSSGQTRNLYFGGIDWDAFCEQQLGARKEAAHSLNADLIYTYANTGKFKGAAHVYAGSKGYATRENCLNYQDSTQRDTCYAHSGGTQTLYQGVISDNVHTDYVVLAAPALLSQQKLMELKNHGVKKVVVYQSPQDVLYQTKIRIDKNHAFDLFLPDGTPAGTSYAPAIEVGGVWLDFKAVMGVYGLNLDDIPIETEEFWIGRNGEGLFENYKDGEFEIETVTINAPGMSGGDMHALLNRRMITDGRNGLIPGIPKIAIPDYQVDKFDSSITTAHDPNIKYGPTGRVQAGQTLDYRVEFENEGEGIAYGVYFTDVLDDDLDASTLTIGPVYSTMNNQVVAQPGIYDPDTRTITWSVGEVGAKAGGYSNISVNIRNDAPDDTEIVNFGTVYFPSVPEITITNGLVAIVGLNRPPVLENIPDQVVNVTDTIQIYLTATDPDGDRLSYRAALENGTALPSGAQFDPVRGSFRWAPAKNQAGMYRIMFTATDSKKESQDVAEIAVAGAVVNGTGPSVTVPGAIGLPTDIDRDGKCEDVNGNNRPDFADVVLFFNQMGWIASNEPVTAFDYNANGRIDFADVVWLFTHL